MCSVVRLDPPVVGLDLRTRLVLVGLHDCAGQCILLVGLAASVPS